MNPGIPSGIIANQASKAVSNVISDPETQSKVFGISDEDKLVWKAVCSYPMVPAPFNYVCLVLNIFLPGVGTIMSSFFPSPISKTQIAVGIL